MLENIKACIFDMDGTLIESMGLWKEIDREFFARYNKELPADYQKRIEGLNMYETAVCTKEYYGFDMSVEAMMAEWNEMAKIAYSEEIKFKPYAKEALFLLKQKGIKLGVATSNSGYLFNAFADSNNIYDLIEVAVVGEDVTKGKPEPECYLTVADRLKVEPKNCLVFEDILVGLTAGKKAGMKLCAVWDSYSVYQWEEKKAFADCYINDFAELIDIINDEL